MLSLADALLLSLMLSAMDLLVLALVLLDPLKDSPILADSDSDSRSELVKSLLSS